MIEYCRLNIEYLKATSLRAVSRGSIKEKDHKNDSYRFCEFFITIGAKNLLVDKTIGEFLFPCKRLRNNPPALNAGSVVPAGSTRSAAGTT